MPRPAWTMALLVASLGLLGGCRDDEDTEPAGRDEPASAAPGPDASAAGGGDDGRSERPPLEEVVDDAMGYAIRLPEGWKRDSEGRHVHTYTRPVPGGDLLYTVQITPTEQADLDALVKRATELAQREVVRMEELGEGDHLVVTEAVAELQAVWVGRSGDGRGLTVKCTGPADRLDRVERICRSANLTREPELLSD